MEYLSCFFLKTQPVINKKEKRWSIYQLNPSPCLSDEPLLHAIPVVMFAFGIYFPVPITISQSVEDPRFQLNARERMTCIECN